jgi:hypothetical protein
MNKFLKNYTSEVPVNDTVGKIEQTLIRCGVAGIMKEYSDVNGSVAALTFQLQTFEGKVSIRLPVSVNMCQDAFWSDYVNGDQLSDDGNSLRWSGNKKKRRQDFRQQAERTAWKIMQDWVEVQMSMIQMKQAEPMQVFLPYVMVDDQTSVFQQIKATHFKGLLAAPKP